MITDCSLTPGYDCVTLSVTVDDTEYLYRINTRLLNAANTVYTDVKSLKGQILDICNIDETGFDLKAGNTHVMFQI